MQGLYIHLPFCAKACSYCNFHFSTSLKYKERMVNSILKEADKRKAYLPKSVYDTIYIGGGTPSLLSSAEIHHLISGLHSIFSLNNLSEFTFEANPDDLTPSYLKTLKKAGVNRLSIGIQSFRDEDLSFLGRIHTSEQITKALKLANDMDFDLTVDLIYGIPGLSDKDWSDNLNRLLEFNIRHFSAYALTVEPNTLLHHQVKQKKVEIPQDEAYRCQYDLLLEFCRNNDFEQYELSNFRKNGAIGLHNNNYWKGHPYIGLGPSAHSFDGLNRQWNVANNTKYLKALEEGEPFFEIEELSEADRFNEYLITGLRTIDGITLNKLNEFSIFAENKSSFDLRVKEFTLKGWMLKSMTGYRLSPDGMMMSDYILRELILEI